MRVGNGEILRGKLERREHCWEAKTLAWLAKDRCSVMAGEAEGRPPPSVLENYPGLLSPSMDSEELQI